MSRLDTEDVNHSLLSTLKEAENSKRTGIFKLFKDSEQIGVIVIREGKMAWASSVLQTEKFGSFLERIGMIPKERQRELIDQIKILGKTKDLGELLKEAGLISRATLRKCLRKQVQVAVEALIETENIVVRDIDCEVNVNNDLLFHLNEVISDHVQPVRLQDLSNPEVSKTTGSENIKGSNGLGNVLKNLLSLTGYQYSFIYDQDKKVLASHKSETFNGNFEEIITSSIPCIITTKTSLDDSKIGSIDFILLEHDKGSLVAQWPYFEKNFFLAASFDKNGKAGVIRHKISDLIPSILNITGQSH